jgi:hypothetical protein
MKSRLNPDFRNCAICWPKDQQRRGETMEQECIPEECQGQWQMKEIELTPKAEEDLEAIWDFSFRQIGVVQADA